MKTYAPLFLSHGSPMLVLEQTPTVAFLHALRQRLGTPRAVVAISAHWLTREPRVGGAAHPSTIHDFGGFPPALYQINYPAPGDPALAARVAGLMGPTAAVDPTRGLDHGIWSVASLIWPEATVPIIPVSLQPHLGPSAQRALGETLRPLSAEGVLILGSGSITHNLRAYMGRAPTDAPEPWALAFADWVEETSAAGSLDALLDYRTRAPQAAVNHPTDEHLLPFFVAQGAAGATGGTALYRSMEYGVIGMDAYEFPLAA